MARNLDDLIAGMSVGRDASVPEAAAGANEYARQMGLVRPNRYDNVLVNIPQARRIAADYLSAPNFDESAIPHFRAMAEETKRQFDFMTKSRRRGGLGMDVEVTENDPYTKPSINPNAKYPAPDPQAMMDDVRNNNRIKVLSTETTGTHPFFTNDENDMFRAVHDFFGHAATGRGFDPHGEEAAFRSHYAMFSPDARPAMATETRGQNSANNYGGLPKGDYAEQKLIALPSTQLITPFGRRAAFQESVAQAKRAHEKAFGPVNEQSS
jgi:hypothetical protein